MLQNTIYACKVNTFYFKNASFLPDLTRDNNNQSASQSQSPRDIMTGFG